MCLPSLTGIGAGALASFYVTGALTSFYVTGALTSFYVTGTFASFYVITGPFASLYVSHDWYSRHFSVCYSVVITAKAL